MATLVATRYHHQCTDGGCPDRASRCVSSLKGVLPGEPRQRGHGGGQAGVVHQILLLLRDDPTLTLPPSHPPTPIKSSPQLMASQHPRALHYDDSTRWEGVLPTSLLHPPEEEEEEEEVVLAVRS